MEKLGCASCEGGWFFTHPFQAFHGKVSHRLMDSDAMKMKLEGEAVEDLKLAISRCHALHWKWSNKTDDQMLAAQLHR